MREIDQVLDELSSRLPELEWKLNKLKSGITTQHLPRGLFSIGREFTGKACIDEIRTDIHSLQTRKSDQGSYFLAERIKQKINVLVLLCQIHHDHKKQEEVNSFKLQALSTRRQWIESMELEIQSLEIQYKAMLKTLGQKKEEKNSLAILPLKAELGELEKKLTLARETLNRALIMM
ncbi:hypothetical protein [Legionella waltersii]|uniref:Coiled-coil protein n=1 Tax=Legionella waltersii TaxID=66969 RepID=A0A0W1A2E5_9GAMM|nr:hypothetical protein [Legionella waltersii]KTD75515.1 hypothetical protein Lwal_2453 [Legionella waltersii]SNU98436.1 putative protein conserved in archaea [Legionella waltersii]